MVGRLRLGGRHHGVQPVGLGLGLGVVCVDAGQGFERKGERVAGGRVNGLHFPIDDPKRVAGINPLAHEVVGHSGLLSPLA